MDQLPGTITVPARDVTRARYIRDRILRTPNARKDRGSQIWVDANTHADTINPIYALAASAGQAVGLDGLSGTSLEQAAIDQGLPRRLPAVGSSGFVICQASSNGGTIFVGDRIKDVAGTGFSFQCTSTALYQAGSNVPVIGIDTGPSTDLPAGTVLQWQTQRPGIGQNAVVFEQQNGDGLDGGSDQENDDGIRARIREARANPPASGNDAEYQTTVEQTPGVPVEKCFTVPAILGPGSMGYAFTTRATSLGGSRVPNPVQIAQTLAFLAAKMPAQDSIFDELLSAYVVNVALQISWAPNVSGWSNAIPWPLAADPTSRPVATTNDVTITASQFVLDVGGTANVGGSQPVPPVGAQIGFYDTANLVTDPTTGIAGPVFRLKTILTAAAYAGQTWQPNTPYQIGNTVIPATPNGDYYRCSVAGISGGSQPSFTTSPTTTYPGDGGVTWQAARAVSGLAGLYIINCDTSNNNSDLVLTPVIGHPCCPWSASLQSLVAPILGHFGSFGPGESTGSAQQFDAGARLRRNPRSPGSWPSDLTHRLLVPLYQSPGTIDDVSVISPVLPLQTPAGVPGVLAYLMQLQYLTAFAE